MSIRTADTAVTFRRPSLLGSVEGLQSVGTCQASADDEEIAGLSCRRLHPQDDAALPAGGRQRGVAA